MSDYNRERVWQFKASGMLRLIDGINDTPDKYKNHYRCFDSYESVVTIK